MAHQPIEDLLVFKVNSLTLRKDIKDVNYHITEGDCTNEQKLQLAYILYRKITNMYKTTREMKENQFEPLLRSIKECNVGALKGSYLQYNDYEYSGRISDNFYTSRACGSFLLQMLNDQNLLQNQSESKLFKDPEEIKTHFIDWLDRVESYEEKSNLIDVLLRHFPKDRIVQERFQNMRFDPPPVHRPPAYNPGIDVPPVIRPPGGNNFYTDFQNVHDHNISESCKEVVKKLFDMYIDILRDVDTDAMIESISQYFVVKGVYDETVMGRLRIDSRELVRIVYLLIVHMQKSKFENELNIRLKEEIKEMKDMCYTGYVTRFVNVLQGFDENFALRMSIESEVQSILSHTITKELNKPGVNENVVAGTYDPVYRTVYVNFVEEVLNKKLKELTQEYTKKDLDECLIRVVNQVTGLKWTYNGRVLKVE